MYLCGVVWYRALTSLNLSTHASFHFLVWVFFWFVLDDAVSQQTTKEHSFETIKLTMRANQPNYTHTRTRTQPINRSTDQPIN
jgi:hypothetical protein